MQELSLKNCRLDRRYDILELLGRGSYAEIFVARDIFASPQSPHSQVVIKALNVNLQNDLDADLERTLVENFQNEAIALDRVRHPNIVSRLGHGTARDLRGTIFHYLVLEYLAGGDLARYCRQKNLTLDEALYFLEQVCAGLSHAHKNGIIHRDIKPQNLLLTKDLKTLKITDFGVARFSQSDSPITRVGTNAYAPPEHSPLLALETGNLSVSKLTAAADIYSLAKTTYFLITGESPRFFTNQPITQLPFAFRQESWADQLLKILNKATQNNPADRYQTVNEFWQDLAHLRSLIKSESGDVTTRLSVRQNILPKAHIARGYTPFAPQKPKFNTSQELKYQNNQIIPKTPAIVVPIDNVSHFSTGKPESLHAFPTSVNSFSDNLPNPQPPPDEIQAAASSSMTQTDRSAGKFFRHLIIFLFLSAGFIGVLFLTHQILSGIAILPSISSIFNNREVIALRDVPLRTDSNANASQIGWVPKNSRVRVVGETETWYKIEVVEFGRTKDPAWQERGWVAKKTRAGEDNFDVPR